LAATEYETAKRTYDAGLCDEYGVPHINGATDADAACLRARRNDFATIEDVVVMTRAVTARWLALTGRSRLCWHLLGAGNRRKALYGIVARVRSGQACAAGLNYYVSKHPAKRACQLFPVTGQDIVTGFVLRAIFYGLDGAIGAPDRRKPQPKERCAHDANRADPEMTVNAFALAPKRMADGKTWLISIRTSPMKGRHGMRPHAFGRRP
jgi:hypothetical protein